MQAAGPVSSSRRLASAVMPLVVLVVLLGLFSSYGGVLLEPIQGTRFPEERLAFDRILLRPHEVILHVVNTSPTEITLAQVMVNGALWDAEVSPSNVLPRLGTARVMIPYPWVEGEPLSIVLISSTGFTFPTEVAVATTTPSSNVQQVGALALLGTYVGVVPVLLGLAWLPFLRTLDERWLNFLMLFTAGLLAFLGFDAVAEAAELVPKVPSAFQGLALLLIGSVGTFLSLLGFSSKVVRGVSGAANLVALAFLIALGIGLHNLGEGLAIGTAYAIGQFALGTFLIVGFTIHNTTEGIAIVAPLWERKVRIATLAGLGLLAGGPTILGTWLGGFGSTPTLSILFLAVGAGAIAQVIYEILHYLHVEARAKLTSASSAAGFVVGLLVMYATGLFVA